MLATRILKQNNRPFRRDKNITPRIARGIELHVDHATEVAQVYGIKQESRINLLIYKYLA